MAEKPKNIVLMSDGTGNAASKVWRTNVWRLFQSLDLTNSRQVANYDDGVGTSSFKPLAVLGGVFGWGLKRNVLDLYTFLCRNYEPGARIYAFGFSRGAFTIRVLLGLVGHEGLVQSRKEAELRRRAVAAYRAYRKDRFHSVSHVETVFRGLRDLALALTDRIARRRPYDRADNVPVPKIQFVGLWDSVAAYGLPIEEMTRGVNQWIWPLELPDRKLGPHVDRACHALALDDERTTFHPVLWSEDGELAANADSEGRRWAKDERISQVWFSGSHSNVGGGYPDDSLAHESLTWIMQEAAICELRFKQAPETDPDAVLFARSSADKDGRLYDSRHGLAGYYRYGPRKLADLCNRKASRREGDEVKIAVPKIHESAIDRTVNGAHAYAPIGLPARYAVVMRNGEICEGKANRFETPEQANRRALVQERVWDLVWWRRVVYFATLGASGYLALFPLLHEVVRANEFSNRWRIVSDTVRLLGAVLPGFAGWWLDAFAASPRLFLVGLGSLATLMAIGVVLGRNINGEMHAIWRTILREGSTPAGGEPSGLVYRLRTHPTYKAVHWSLKRHVIPFVSALLLVYLGAGVVGHLAFNIADAAGAFCRGSAGPLVSLEQTRERTVTGFAASSLCWPTGIQLEEGRRYRITIKDASGWRNRLVTEPRQDAASLTGFEVSELKSVGNRLLSFSVLPLRRVLNRSWFKPIARIGAVGADEYPLDPDPRLILAEREVATLGPDDLVAEIRARRDGELFLYMNDLIAGLPRLTNVVYEDASATAEVTVARAGRR
jgi:uncharacterized protein (DUF2235 family)